MRTSATQLNTYTQPRTRRTQVLQLLGCEGEASGVVNRRRHLLQGRRLLWVGSDNGGIASWRQHDGVHGANTPLGTSACAASHVAHLVAGR